MRILIAPDKFKGTLTAREAAEAMACGWRKARPEDSLELLPISDGGDGFGEVMGELLNARPQSVRTVDAAHRPCNATWWWSSRSRTAIIESARVIGLAMLPMGKFHPFKLDTFGLGKMLLAAQQAGAAIIIVGIGGSATNDAGFGVARALGWGFLDRRGNVIESWARLDELSTIHRPPGRFDGRIVIAVDVQNPLLGMRGATRVYGPQKGLRPEDFPQAERCLRRLVTILKRQFGLDFARVPGTGAAGGLGFGLMNVAGATFEPGFELVASHAQLSSRLRKVDLVVTGEGSLDRTTAMGKGCGEIAGLCKTRRIPCVALGGKVAKSEIGRLFVQAGGLTDLTSPADAMRRPAFWLARLAQNTAASLAANLVCKPARRR